MPTSQPVTLAQALQTPTLTQIQSALLTVLQSQGLPVTDWAVGGVARTMVLADAEALIQFVGGSVPAIVSGGFTSLAASTTPGVFNPWVDLLAQNFYNLTRNPALSTIGTVTMTVALGSGPYTITVGQLQIVDTGSGQVYTNIGVGTASHASPLTVQVQALQPGTAGNIGSGSALILQTPLPGVTITNPSGAFSTVNSIINAGGGSIAVAVTSGTPTPTNVAIRITTGDTIVSGNVRFTYSTTDGSGGDGSFCTAVQTPVSNYEIHQVNTGNITGTDYLMNITMTGTFNAGDYFIFSAPGSWYAIQAGDQAGADKEADALLVTRCQTQWGTVGTSATATAFEAWALAAAPNQVTAAQVATDAAIAGQVDVTLTGPAGSVPSATVATVAAYIAARAPITSKVLVQSVLITTVNKFQCLIYYTQGSNLTALKAATISALNLYFHSVAAGGKAYISQAIRALLNVPGTVGVDFQDWTIATGADFGTGDLTLGSGYVLADVATSGSPVQITGATWIAV